MLQLIHYLHIVSGVTWAGAVLASALIFTPAMRVLEPGAQAAVNAAFNRFAGPVLGISGGLVMLTGIARAIVGGGIRSLGDVFGPYGLWVLGALAVAVVIGGFGDVNRARLARMVGEGGDARAAIDATRIGRVVEVAGVLVVIGIMVVLGMGLY